MDAVTLADYQRGVLRNAFRSAVARGEARPLMLLACAVPAIVVPAAFLAVAGRHRTLQPLRYAVGVALTAYNLHQLSPLWNDPSWTRTSSLNFASAFGAGLVYGWGTLWSLVLLVWTDPWDGERVARRRKRSPPEDSSEKPEKSEESDADKAESTDDDTDQYVQDPQDAPDEDIANSLRLGHEYYWQSFPAHGSFFARFDWTLDLCLAWRGIGWSWGKTPVPNFAPPIKPHTRELVRLSTIPEGTRQGYSRKLTRAAFYRARLTALVCSYLVLDACAILMTHDPYFIVGPPPKRYIPWLEQSSVFPSPALGNIRTLPPLPSILAMPAYLNFVYSHPWLLDLYRSVLGLVGMLAALHIVLSLDQLVRVFFGNLIFGRNSIATASTAAQLWHYPSIFGSVQQVLDHGLAGFWGGAWHQTFRTAFLAPTLWLVDKGILPKGENESDKEKTPDGKGKETDVNGVAKANGNANGHAAKTGTYHEKTQLPFITRTTGLVFAFGQSALLHGAASITTLPTHTIWQGSAMFFVLSGVSVAVEAFLLPPSLMSRLPRRVRQAVNVVFTLGWLHATVWLFLDDTSRSGLWLFEPIPFSPLRLLASYIQGGEIPPIVNPAGSNRAGWSAWRWYSDDILHWHNGRTWWETGLAI